MSLSPKDWHNRFLQQSGWTQSLRPYLLARLGLSPASRVLETGCGTGAITAALNAETSAQIFGLDLNPAYLRLAQRNDPGTRYTNANALHLPFSEDAFDAVVCHFFLLWVPQAAAALAEMRRVTRPGGAIIAFAEPDYGGRIDYPTELVALGQMQAEALRRQGADVTMGRKLSGLFHQAGLRNIETGLLGAQWQERPSPAEIDLEWKTLEADLVGSFQEEKLIALQRINNAAWENGSRVLFVPTFYAVGYKP